MFWAAIIVVFFVVLGSEASTTEPSIQDPCGNYEVITDNTRAANLKLDLDSTYPFTDDRVKPGWYRIQNEVGDFMPTKPPGPFMCNTWYPIWLNGTLPSNKGETKIEIACLQTFYATCARSWIIQIKRCSGEYLVYELAKSPVIDSGYCFGWAKPCEDGKTSDHCELKTTKLTNLNTTTTMLPVITGSATSTENKENQGGLPQDSDPCGNYEVITDNTRAANLKLDLDSTYPFTDDRVKPGWYRIQNEVGDSMPTKPPGPFMCNTWYPIWLNGTLPSKKGETKLQTACLQTFYETCTRSWNIQIKRCSGDYLVYELAKSPVIDSGYCFGWAKSCENGETSDHCKKTTSYSTESTTTTITTPIVTASATTTEFKTESTDEDNEYQEMLTSGSVVIVTLSVLVMLSITICIIVRRHGRKTSTKHQFHDNNTKPNIQKMNDPLFFVQPGKQKYLETLPPSYSSIYPYESKV